MALGAINPTQNNMINKDESGADFVLLYIHNMHCNAGQPAYDPWSDKTKVKNKFQSHKEEI